MEIHTANLGRAEELLSVLAGPDKEIIDVQRFGDRLDIVASDPDAAKRVADEALKPEGLAIDDVRIDEPTLENIFVATLRNLGETVQLPSPFRDGAIAVRSAVRLRSGPRISRRSSAISLLSGT